MSTLFTCKTSTASLLRSLLFLSIMILSATSAARAQTGSDPLDLSQIDDATPIALHYDGTTTAWSYSTDDKTTTPFNGTINGEGSSKPHTAAITLKVTNTDFSTSPTLLLNNVHVRVSSGSPFTSTGGGGFAQLSRPADCTETSSFIGETKTNGMKSISAGILIARTGGGIDKIALSGATSWEWANATTAPINILGETGDDVLFTLPAGILQAVVHNTSPVWLQSQDKSQFWKGTNNDPKTAYYHFPASPPASESQRAFTAMEAYTVDVTTPFDISGWDNKTVYLYHNERFWLYFTGDYSGLYMEMQATPFSGILTGTFSGQSISVWKTQAQSTLTLQAAHISGLSAAEAFSIRPGMNLTLDIAGIAGSSITASQSIALGSMGNSKLTINATQPLTLKAENAAALNNDRGSTLNVNATAPVRIEGRASIANGGTMTLGGTILAKGNFVNPTNATLALGTNPDVKILTTGNTMLSGTLPSYLNINLDQVPEAGKEILLYQDGSAQPAATFTTEGQYTQFIAFTTSVQKWKAKMAGETLYSNYGATFFPEAYFQAFTAPQPLTLADFLPAPITLTHDSEGWKYDDDLFNGTVQQKTSHPLILEAEGTATLAIDFGIELKSDATALTIGKGDIRLSGGNLTIQNARTAIHVKSGATFTLTDEMADKLFITSGNYVNEAGGIFVDQTGTVTQVVDGNGAPILSYTPPATIALIPEKTSEVSIQIVIPVGNAPVLTLQKKVTDAWQDVPPAKATAQDVRSTTLSVTFPGEGTYRVGIRVGTTTLFTKPITVSKPKSLDLSEQTEDITIGFDAQYGVWHYTPKAITRAIPADAIAFDGTVTGKLAKNKTIAIDNTAQGTLTFDDTEIDAGSSGPALTVAAGATVTFVGTLTATTADGNSPALLNNGAITIGDATISATNTADPAKGISISDGAALLLTGNGSELKASGLENKGTVVVKDGASLTDASGVALQETYAVTITAPANGNTLTVKAAGDIPIATGDKVAENTELTITATAATNYSPEKITVTPESGTAVEVNNNGTYTMGTAAVTIAATFKYTPPVTPPTPPVYYTVTLPTVEGATTDPGAGNHEVESWDSFRFYLTLDEDYNLSEPVVTTSRGETLSPRSSDGAYTVKQVRTDVVLTISGIVKNPDPVANAELQSGTRIHAQGGVLFITVDRPARAQLINYIGQTIRSLSLPAGETRVDQLAAGVYIVRLDNGTVQKAIVGSR